MSKVALITGVAGQDGVLISRLLQARGYDVAGLVRPGSQRDQRQRLASSIQVLECDMAQLQDLRQLVCAIRPDEIYNLAGLTTIAEAEESPQRASVVMVEAVEVMLNAAYQERIPVRFIQAGSAMIFEGADASPQSEVTPASPLSVYARAKCASMDVVRAARARGQFASTAILYNHESPLRDERFVTRKISQGAARIALGLADDLSLGSLSMRRDWGWAPDYVRGMWLMAQADDPDDYVLATGVVHSVEDFARYALEAAGIQDWAGRLRGSMDLGRRIDSSVLCGDSSRARSELGWLPTLSLREIAIAMVRHDLRLLTDPAQTWEADFPAQPS